MIDEDQLPIDAVSPTGPQKAFLSRLMETTRQYARSKNYNDMHFLGHDNESYFCAYSNKTERRFFVFGFDKEGKDSLHGDTDRDR